MDADADVAAPSPAGSRTSSMREACGLQVREWTGAGAPVLGLPGLTSSSVVWNPLARELPDARVVAPDLRGRGASTALGGPSGLRAHARDVATIAAELDLREVVLIGHSMGAYLAPLVAQEIPERVSRVVLVDGGLPPALPFFMGRRLTRAIFRRDLRRFDRHWTDLDSFAKGDLERALRSRPDLLPEVMNWLAEEMDGPAGALRPRLDTARAVDDAVDTFFGDDVVPALEALAVPAHLVAATSGKHDDAKAFLSDRVVAQWKTRLPTLTAERVDANHLTVLFSPQVAQAVRG